MKRLPTVRHLASVRPVSGAAPLKEMRFAPSCVDLAYVRVLVSRAKHQKASDASLLLLLRRLIRGLDQFAIENDELTILTRDETSEYRYRVTLPQVP